MNGGATNAHTEAGSLPKVEMAVAPQDLDIYGHSLDLASTCKEPLTGNKRELMDDVQPLPRTLAMEKEESIGQDRLNVRTSHQFETAYSTFLAQGLKLQEDEIVRLKEQNRVLGHENAELRKQLGQLKSQRDAQTQSVAKARRQRVRLSCDECRRKKIRCKHRAMSQSTVKADALR